MFRILKNIVFPFSFMMIFSFSLNAQKQFLKELFISNSDTLPYNILKPYGFLRGLQKDSNQWTGKKYPLLLFLHGAGERGKDNEKHIIHIEKLFLDDYNYSVYNTFVVAPQCPEGKQWVEVDWSAKSHLIPKEPSWALKNTMSLIKKIITEYPVDTTRIYITGLSMGGYGTWDAISRYPDFFAAAIPICGGGDENIAEKIKDVPIWAFHGSNDKVVPVERTQNMINAIKQSGASPKYTEYKGVGHASWVKAFKEKQLLEWLFAQHLD